MRARLVFVLVLAAAPGAPQTRSVAAKGHRMQITVERLEKSGWTRVDPGLVFEQNDRVRFRYSANFAGYLYVINRSTSGKTERLFPGVETGQDNHIAAGRDYTIPATDTVFRIAGPAGHELIYWLASPVELGKAAGEIGVAPNLPPESKPQASDFMPRCDDVIFRARGECVDSSAGPQPVTKDEQLPKGLTGASQTSARDLMFLRQEKKTVVASPVPLTSPVIYEFRLAHK